MGQNGKVHAARPKEDFVELNVTRPVSAVGQNGRLRAVWRRPKFKAKLKFQIYQFQKYLLRDYPEPLKDKACWDADR